MVEEPRHVADARESMEPEDLATAPEVFYIHVPPKKRTGETVALLVTLILLFLLLVVFVGHPKPPPHAQDVAPAHASSLPDRR